MDLVGRSLQALLARIHAGCGWAALRLGWRTLARRHYERVLVLRGSDFGAYVQLGRLAFTAGDYAGWRREFEHARRADPKRFARLRHPFELFEPRLAGTDFDETGDRATWRSLLPFGGASMRHQLTPRVDTPADAGLDALLPGWDMRVDATTEASAERPHQRHPDDRDPDRQEDPGRQDDPGRRGDPDARSMPHDDCQSDAERRRLAALGPVRAADVRRCDLDDLARRLCS
ncbi:MAG: hypothetical protein JNM25_16165 [Planctomycetes bacterium]|nr:hypothetical protein [Planctomycetota bacterium]